MYIPWKLSVLLLSLFIVTPSLTEFSNSVLEYPSNNQTTSLKPGDWIEYLGTTPNKSYRWMKISILLVQDQNITIKVLSEKKEKVLQGNITTGEGFDFPYIIPANLNVGDTISTSYLPLNITKIFVREYAGSPRKTIYAFSENNPWNFPTEFYWDQRTGIILEVSVFHYNIRHTVLRAVRTNMWSKNFVSILKEGSIFLIPALLTALITAVLYVVYKRSQEIEFSKGFLFKVYRNIDKLLIVTGAALFVLAILCISPSEQVISSISFLLAVPLTSIGFYLKSESWIGKSTLEKLFDFLIMSSMVLLAYAVVAASYSKIPVEVPTKLVVGFTPTGAETVTVFRGISIHPFAWLTTPLLSAGLPLLVLGILMKIREI
ncbi:MAG: hypothetical protein ACTSYM_08885 [Candidatus Baldrarchaeia archaeon]